MTLCYIDAFSGVAGDMLVGAFADAGANRDDISGTLRGLGVEASFEWDRVQRRGVTATKFHVRTKEQHKHRHLGGILKMIESLDAPDRVKSRAEKVFRVLAEAEAEVHGVDIEKVHFHEVGAVDSICDIAGVCVALELLNVDSIHCSAINVGSGTVRTEHGVLPVPAPATAKLLVNRPVYSRGPELELTTPTGAAVLAALATGPDAFGPMPPMQIRSIGYGAGDHDFPEHANVVRAIIGEHSRAQEANTVTVIEANIDDASPQVIGHAMEVLLEAGVLDALLIPVQMKKNRPGVMVQVIARRENREELAAILFRETTTLGLRFYDCERRVQAREWVTVNTRHGTVRVKAGIEGFAPEYEDARKIAALSGVPLKQVLAEAAYEYLKDRK